MNKTKITGLLLAALLLSSTGLAALNQGLEAYWKFDSGSGDTAKDSSGNSNTGSISGASWTQGKFGEALSFDGVDDRVDIPDRINNGGFTISLWFKPEGSDWGGSLYDMSNDPRYFYVSAQSSQMQWYMEDSEDDDMQITVNENFGEAWHHVVVTGKYNSDGPHEVFINGTKKASNNLYLTSKPSLASPELGSETDSYGSPGDFNGVIDETRVYNRVLSDSEIQNLSEYDPGFCNARGLNNECIMNETNDLEPDTYNVNSIFQSTSKAELNSLNGQAHINITNSTEISGLWQGSFFIDTERPRLVSGARFRPVNGDIAIGS
ncbi:LamG domain-containing protein [Candidatus Nanosalina sp. VS9-1]|uniref:LamG domain-containing protein n=1 Tax=Candidatus Nanosalina sp. VS9-1 TaxID=3388566 RepID=UPI0039E044FE